MCVCLHVLVCVCVYVCVCVQVSMLQSEVEAMGDMFTRMNRQCYGKFFSESSCRIRFNFLWKKILMCIYACVLCACVRMNVQICTDTSMNGDKCVWNAYVRECMFVYTFTYKCI